jgi:hypothetical protein
MGAFEEEINLKTPPKKTHVIKERQERNVRKRVLRIIFTIKTNGGFPNFLTSTVTEIFMEMSFCTPERFPEISGKREVTS